MGLRQSIYLAAAWLFALLNLATYRFADPDLWGRLSIGALYFQNGKFPYHDVFSYTAAHAHWIDHEWLTGLVFYQVLTRFGEAGFVAFKAGLLLGVFYGIFRLHQSVYKVSTLWACYGFMALLGVYSIGWYATLRSHAFSFLGFVLFLYALEAIRQHGSSWKKHLGLVALGILWGNLHGGFIMGILLLLCYSAGEGWRHRKPKAALPYALTAIGILGGLALLNPYGPPYLQFLWHAWTLDRSIIQEWSALPLNRWLFPEAQLLAASTLIVLLFHLKHSFQKQSGSQPCSGIPLAPALVLLLLVAMTLKSARIQSFLAMAAIAYAPLFLSPGWMWQWVPNALKRTLRAQRSALENTLPVLILVGSIAGLVYLHSQSNLLRVPMDDELSLAQNPPVRYPLAALNYLEQSPYQGNLLVRFGLGEFAYWRLFPRFKVSMDGRYEEVYTQAQALENDAFYERNDVIRAHKAAVNLTQPSITPIPPDFILTEPKLPNSGILLQSPEWTVLYADHYFVLFGRKQHLEQFPTDQPKYPMLTQKITSIEDQISPMLMKRFKLEEPN